MYYSYSSDKSIAANQHPLLEHTNAFSKKNKKAINTTLQVKHITDVRRLLIDINILKTFL